jgi:hypothetical protein
MSMYDVTLLMSELVILQLKNIEMQALPPPRTIPSRPISAQSSLTDYLRL